MPCMPLVTLGGILPPIGVLASPSLPDKEKCSRVGLGVGLFLFARPKCVANI